MHSTRWITGLIAAPLLVLLIALENIWFFCIFVAVAAVVSLWEYGRINTPPSQTGQFRVITFIGYLTVAGMVVAAGRLSAEMMVFTAFAGLIGCAMIALRRFKSDPDIPDVIARQILGIVYIGLPLGMIVLIRGGQTGCFWVIAILVIIFGGDTAAYYTGSCLGKHKLCPSVSPKKTIEGALGGLAANALTGIVLKLFFLRDAGWIQVLLMAVIIGAVGQIGDLFESVLKRRVGIKDSGGILPGHGGILDRIDALLFAIPVAWIFIVMGHV